MNTAAIAPARGRRAAAELVRRPRRREPDRRRRTPVPRGRSPRAGSRTRGSSGRAAGGHGRRRSRLELRHVRNRRRLARVHRLVAVDAEAVDLPHAQEQTEHECRKQHAAEVQVADAASAEPRSAHGGRSTGAPQRHSWGVPGSLTGSGSDRRRADGGRKEPVPCPRREILLRAIRWCPERSMRPGFARTNPLSRCASTSTGPLPARSRSSPARRPSGPCR